MSGIPAHQAFDLQGTRRPGPGDGVGRAPTPRPPGRPRPRRGPRDGVPLFPEPAGRAAAMHPCERPGDMGKPAWP